MTATVFPKTASSAPRLPPQGPIPERGPASPRAIEIPPWKNRSECDIETIRKAQLGDAMAWEILVRQNVGWIFSICRRWGSSGARAEDLTQDVFLKVFQNLHSYRGELAGFRAWLSQLVRNLLVDDYRRNRSERFTLSYDSDVDWMKNGLASLHSDAVNPEVGFKRKERRAALRNAFQRLGPEQRQAVILHDMLDMTYEEIGNMLQTPVGTVKSRVNRGRIELVALMRQRMAKQTGFGPGASAVA